MNKVMIFSKRCFLISFLYGLMMQKKEEEISFSIKRHWLFLRLGERIDR